MTTEAPTLDSIEWSVTVGHRHAIEAIRSGAPDIAIKWLEGTISSIIATMGEMPEELPYTRDRFNAELWHLMSLAANHAEEALKTSRSDTVELAERWFSIAVKLRSQLPADYDGARTT